jgi:hypothetical protein
MRLSIHQSVRNEHRAIVLDLMHPVGAGRRLGSAGRDAGLNKTGGGGNYGHTVRISTRFAGREIGRIRVIDQVKRFAPDHLVTANDVRALMGVLQTDGAAKGFLTTTSDFAPLIRVDPLITPFIPSRLELINGTALLERLKELARNRGGAAA